MKPLPVGQRPPIPIARDGGIRRGTPVYRQISLALFLAGFATFSMLYCVQPLLPEFARDFKVSATSSSLALSTTTAALAFAIFAAGAVSQSFPRRGLMLGSLLLAAFLNILSAQATHWPWLLAARFVEGIALGGVPAVAMAYLAEEMHPSDLGKAMGLYVAGTAFGGMMGRVGMGLLTDIWSWRVAMTTLGTIDLAVAASFAMLLPTSRNFHVQRGFEPLRHVRIWTVQITDTRQLRIFLCGFVLMSVFVTLFNYAGFRLSQAPYSLSPTQISLIFLVYISGMFASPLAGTLADRFGRRLPMAGGLAMMVAGSLLTLSPALPLIALGIMFVTMGFFASHAVASGWIGHLAGPEKGHAAALYLLCYYLGSSITGAVGGWFWQHLEWPGVVALTGCIGLIGVALALSMPWERVDG